MKDDQNSGQKTKENRRAVLAQGNVGSHSKRKLNLENEDSSVVSATPSLSLFSEKSGPSKNKKMKAKISSKASSSSGRRAKSPHIRDPASHNLMLRFPFDADPKEIKNAAKNLTEFSRHLHSDIPCTSEDPSKRLHSHARISRRDLYKIGKSTGFLSDELVSFGLLW